MLITKHVVMSTHVYALNTGNFRINVDNVALGAEALVQEVAVPHNVFAEGVGSPGSPAAYNRDSALLEDDDIDDAMLVMPLGPGNRSSLGQSSSGAAGASASGFRGAHRSTRSRDAAARSTHTAIGGCGGGPPSAYATMNANRARSTISIERGNPSRKGSIALGRGTARGKSASAGVQAIGITAEGFFSAPDAPPVPSLPPRPQGDSQS